MSDKRAEPSANIRHRIEAARERQTQRFSDHPGLFANADMGAGEVQDLCLLTIEARQVLELSVKRMQLSARAYHRVLKLSRTIADIDGDIDIQVNHVAEAIQYRPKATQV